VRSYRASRGLKRADVVRGKTAEAVERSLWGKEPDYYKSWDGGEFGACSIKQFKGVSVGWDDVRRIEQEMNQVPVAIRAKREPQGRLSKWLSARSRMSAQKFLQKKDDMV